MLKVGIIGHDRWHIGCTAAIRTAIWTTDDSSSEEKTRGYEAFLNPGGRDKVL
jgi:hypothetical protein